jgi:type III secretion protein J
MTALAGCHEMLQEGLGQHEANEILLVLGRAGIEADKVGRDGEAGWSVRVGPDERAEALRLLGEAGLPRRRHQGFRNVYHERGLVPGRLEEQALFQSALQEEIAQTLESVQGVTSARVHLSLAGEGRFGHLDPGTAASASVLMGYRPSTGSGSPPIGAEEVMRLVASAVQGLEPDRVVVVFSPALPSFDPLRLAEPPGTWALVGRWIALGLAVLALGGGLLLGVLRKQGVVARVARMLKPGEFSR